MIAADDVQPMAVQRGAQCIAVGLGLDRRVAFDQVAERWVVTIIEQQMVQADFGGDVFLRQWFVFEQRQFTCGGQVQNVQARAMTLGQVHGQ